MTAGDEDWVSGADFNFKTPVRSHAAKLTGGNVRSPINTRRRTTLALGQHKGPLLTNSDEEDSPPTKALTSVSFYKSKKTTTSTKTQHAKVEAETIQQSKLKKSATAQIKSKVPTASKTTVSSRRRSMIVNAKTETNLVPRTPITTTARRTRRSVAAGMVISPVQEITTNNIPERISEEVTETPLEAAAEVTKDSEANLEVCGETVEVVMSQSSVTVVDVAAVLPELNVIVEAPVIEQKPAIDSPLLSETQLSSVKKTPARGRRSEPMTRVLERSEKKTPARSRKSAVVKPEDEMKEMTEQKSEKKKTPARVRKSAIMKLPDKGEGCPVMEISEAMPKEKKKTPGRPRKSTTIAEVNQAKPSSTDKVSNQPKMMAIKSKKSADNSRTTTDVTSVLEAESETNKSVEQASTKSPGRPRKSENVADKKLSATKPKMMAISSKRTLPNPTTVALTAAENITPELSDVKTPEVKSQKRRSTTKVATPAEKVSKKTDTGTKRRKPTPNRLMAVRRNAGVLDMSMGDNSMMFMTPDGKSQAKRDFSNTPYHTPGKPDTNLQFETPPQSDMELNDTIVSADGDMSRISQGNEQGLAVVPPAAKSWCSIM